MDRVLDINVRGVVATTQAALKHIKGVSTILVSGGISHPCHMLHDDAAGIPFSTPAWKRV
jgi:NAD(P)-dependent dehydrogenase (short-subunit alcohol dehydrogenase family)